MSYYDGPERAQNIITDHSCLHEIDLALISERQNRTLQLMEDIKARQQEVLSMIFGNGEPGLKTQINSHKDAIKRQWWALGIIIVGLAGLAFRSLL